MRFLKESKRSARQMTIDNLKNAIIKGEIDNSDLKFAIKGVAMESALKYPIISEIDRCMLVDDYEESIAYLDDEEYVQALLSDLANIEDYPMIDFVKIKAYDNYEIVDVVDIRELEDIFKANAQEIAEEIVDLYESVNEWDKKHWFGGNILDILKEFESKYDLSDIDDEEYDLIDESKKESTVKFLKENKYKSDELDNFIYLLNKYYHVYYEVILREGNNIKRNYFENESSAREFYNEELADLKASIEYNDKSEVTLNEITIDRQIEELESKTSIEIEIDNEEID